MISREDFHSRLLSVAEENQLKISAEAEDLIFRTLSALENDPNPNWPREAINQLANRYVDNIELFVRAYSGRWPDEWYRRGFPGAPWKFPLRRRRDVHYFDALHFIGENLSWLNPFPKDVEER
jgi:hypothetical protein